MRNHAAASHGSLRRSVRDSAAGARAADLVVWWDKGFYAQEDKAIREVIAAFEQDSGKQVDLVLDEQAELPDSIEAAIAANQPPHVAFGLWLGSYLPKWALEDRLVDLSDPVGHFADLFDPNQLDRPMLLNDANAELMRTT